MTHTLALRADSEGWRLFSARRNDAAFQKFAKRIQARDRYTCTFCGFQAREYQEIVNSDANYRNNRQDNLVTSCCFCTQSLFLNAIGIGGYGGGTLIYLPEISQAQLNSLCHVLFCAISNNTGYKNSAQNLYRTLKFRSQFLQDAFGEGFEEPATFAQMLIESRIPSEKQNSLLDSLRLLPSRASFKKQIETWARSALAELGG